MKKQVIDLGYENCWDDDSKSYDILRDIREKGGKFEHFLIGNCDHKYVYEDDDKIVIYYVDTSD